MGGSASGKSVLMKAIAGRLHDVSIGGGLFVNGNVLNPNVNHGLLGYYDHEDDLIINELSARELLTLTASMKVQKHNRDINNLVDNLLLNFNLLEVADKQIQPLLFSGLSDDQKRRVSLCNQLVSPPPVLLVDELTSGLDSSMAFEILQCLRELVTSSNGNLSILLTIHQPPMRTLELFDNILLLGGGSMLYFGTLLEVTPYLGSLGFTPPAGNAPLDYFLQIYDEKNQKNTYNFITAFEYSVYYRNLLVAVEDRSNSCKENNLPTNGNKTVVTRRSSFLLVDKSLKYGNQLLVLIKRNILMCMRDLTLYWCQFIVLVVFGTIVGISFSDMQFTITRHVYHTFAAISFLIDMMTFLLLFKTYHVNKRNKRAKNDFVLNLYSPFTYWLSELLVSAIFLILSLPGVTISYFLMGFKSSSFLFSLLACWMVSLLSVI